MKNKDLQTLSQAIKAVGNLKGVKFAYALGKTSRLINQELEAFNDLLKPTDDFKKYDDKRLKLCEEHADKDKAGKPVIVNNNFAFKDLTKFNTAHAKLKKTFDKKIFTDREKQMDEFNDFLDKETTIKLHKVAMADVPADISTAEIGGIMDLIEDK